MRPNEKIHLFIIGFVILCVFYIPSAFADVPSFSDCKLGQNPKTSFCTPVYRPNNRKDYAAQLLIITGGAIFIIAGISTVALMEIRKRIK